MLQQMRSAAKYIWIVLIFAFVGGFLLVQTSGLLGRTPLTPTTPVAVVNRHEILWTDYQRRIQSETQTEQQRQGRSLTQDDIRRIENGVFDQMVMDVLLDQEYARRGIVVTDEEIRDYARFAPPPWIQQAPDLQTDGRFDLQKYQRLLASPIARQQGLLASLESYYRAEIPRQKLYEQIASGIYVTDDELWRIWRDAHDSAQVSYVAFRPAVDSTAAKAIPESELRDYFDKHKDEFKQVGRAVLSVVEIPRAITKADSDAARARAVAIRGEIVGGAKFEDVAKRESADSGSAVNGGDLGRGPKGRFVPDFEKAVYSLKPGEISEPVLSPFGYHIIRVDSRTGDTAAVHHILVRIQQSDSSATRVDKMADTLSTMAANAEQPAKLDSAAHHLGLKILKVVAFENEPATYEGRAIPSVSAWAFGGAKAGETSELFDDETGYYLARLDSLKAGGEPSFETSKDEIRQRLATQRGLDKVMPSAQQLATAAAASSLDAAAKAQNLQVAQTPVFNRGMFVPGLGQFNEAVGAAFGLKPGQVSAPVKTTDAVFVERVDKLVASDSSAWIAQKAVQRQQRLQQLRQQKIQMYLQDLRRSAKVDDRRKDINATTRRSES